MKNISNFITEKYSPVFNRVHGKLVNTVLKAIINAIKKNEISKEDALEMLEDARKTIEVEY